MKKIATRWAAAQSARPPSLMWCYILAANGLVWIALYLTMYREADHLLGLGAVFLALAFGAFERAGFMSLLQRKTPQK